jgi:hypothetical protein
MPACMQLGLYQFTFWAFITAELTVAMNETVWAMLKERSRNSDNIEDLRKSLKLLDRKPEHALPPALQVTY